MNLPFQEAIDFFRRKVNLPTETWTDIWQGMHGRAFVVAGAMKSDLLTDLRAATDKAIADGTTLEEFRKDFDPIVQKHGWAYKGGRGWRTRVIYDTNTRQAHNAGRWKQIQDPDIQKARPYLEYRHGDSLNPRPLHLSWDGKVLRADDPWWETHYPQNGWGCKCKVFTRAKEDLEKLGKTGPDTAPDDGTYEWTDKKTGKTHTIPNGIDPGFAYNVGEAAGQSYKILMERLETMDYGVARKWMDETANGPAFTHFLSGKAGGEFPVAVLAENNQKLIKAKTRTVWLSRDTLMKNQARHPDVTAQEYRLLPRVIDDADVVIQDGASTQVYIKRNQDILHASIKATATGEAIYLTSFRRSGMKDVARMKKRGKVLKEKF